MTHLGMRDSVLSHVKNAPPVTYPKSPTQGKRNSLIHQIDIKYTQVPLKNVTNTELSFMRVNR
jgi:hypothetical protein